MREERRGASLDTTRAPREKESEGACEGETESRSLLCLRVCDRHQLPQEGQREDGDEPEEEEQDCVSLTPDTLTIALGVWLAAACSRGAGHAPGMQLSPTEEEGGTA